MEQRSKEWFEQRKGRVTASNVGAILGLSPYMTREDVMRAMVRESLGAEREFMGNAATQWGEFNEDGARHEFEMEYGVSVDKCGFYPYSDWLGASPDGLIGKNAIWECKSPYKYRKETQPVFPPIQELPHYYAQVQIQLLCTNRDECYFYQWTPHASQLQILSKNSEWLNEKLPILSEFNKEYLYELENNSEEYLKPKRTAIDSAKAHAMIEEWDTTKEQIELLQERQKDLLNSMVEMAKGNNSIIAGRKLTLVEKEGSVSYSKALKQLLPDADLEPYRGNPTQYWKLT